MNDSIFELIQPVGLQKALRKYANFKKKQRVASYWSSLSSRTIRDAVDYAISRIQGLTDAQVRDPEFLEKSLLPQLGLNNEMLQEQPAHLKEYYGKGLHIWQYPVQFGPFLASLSERGAGVRKYLEVGVRWGGTFIAVSEFLRRISPGCELSIAVDPIAPSPLMRYYCDLGRAKYRQCLSTSETFKALIATERPDFVFIDGDHSLRGVMNDFHVCSSSANLIAFHDIASDGCVDTTLFWSFLKRHAAVFDSFEFVDQYDSVVGSFMGIGALLRKNQLQAGATG
jgi:hypothetical protein